MTIDNLQRFIELQRALVEEKSAIESRLRTIEQALGNMGGSIPSPAPLPQLSEKTEEPSPVTAPFLRKRKMSAEGRKRIAEAQRLRRAKERGESPAPKAASAPKPGKRTMSEEARKAIAAAAKKRWAAAKAAGKSRL